MNSKRSFIDAVFLKKSVDKIIILSAFVFASHCAWAEKTPTSVLHYQGVVNGTVQFEKVACYDMNNDPKALYVYAPDLPLVRDGRLFGPRFTLIAGRGFEFVPDQYHQQPLTTFTYDIPANHPAIIWHKEENKNFEITLDKVMMTSIGEDGVRHITYLSGKIYCNIDANQSMQNINKILSKKSNP
ncbi:hypothetical protein [Halothiobacillus neapolitanus]|uniref:Uncharacterized protein n=1 Tax=Halothiobacillus neapolitanus (strain ATCC 23641 / DSM 15147 / CIP 104769 / NCIMB 8539 / c2) TaxID=555778 RepID=D0KX06_HALNC|nr:hypothetical protein [Halothiobacillus neapolitanus]ACX97126.1 hypothetical protein Hneap_2316 [Halothiobacillus neapolitanus c2]TDN60260.1 hypothetical protein C8D83_10415 [Halothiobacillus neapolitanus]